MSFKLSDEEARQVEASSRDMLRLQSQTSEQLQGGEGDNKPDTEFPPEQLDEGIKIEDPQAYTEAEETIGNASPEDDDDQ